jgi:hypothetical protein
MTIYDLVGAGFELNTSIAGLDFIARNHLGNVVSPLAGRVYNYFCLEIISS